MYYTRSAPSSIRLNTQVLKGKNNITLNSYLRQPNFPNSQPYQHWIIYNNTTFCYNSNEFYDNFEWNHSHNYSIEALRHWGIEALTLLQVDSMSIKRAKKNIRVQNVNVEVVFVSFEWFWFYLFIYIFNRCLSHPSMLNYGRYKRIFFKTNYLFIVSLDRFKWRAFCSVSFSFPRQNLGNWLCFKQFTRSSETIISVDTHLLYIIHIYIS